jgi:RNA polymerase sigma factor (sigma-70 family)
VARDDDGVRARPGEDGDPARAADAALVVAARNGDEQAFGRLFDRWFDPVHDIAWRILRDRDTAAEVAQDVFLVAWQGLGDLEQPGSFGGWVRRIARNRALNRLDRERRSLPDSDAAAVALDRTAPDVDMTAALGEREQNELVWAAAAALGERDASLLDLHLRHGMGAAEIASELGVTPNNAHQLLFRLKGKLGGAIRAWVLWRGGGAPCPGLDRAVADAGLTAFGAEAVRVVDRHARTCATCEERRSLRLAPEALFAAVPIGLAPPLVKAEAAAALADAGVPMAGSTVAAGGAGTAGSDGGAGTAGSDGGAGAAGADGGAGSGEGGGAGSDVPPDAGDGVGGGGAGDGAGGADVAGPGEPGSAVAPSAAAPDGAAPPITAASGPGRDGRSRRRVLALAGVALLVLLAAVGVLLAGDDDPDEVATAEPAATTTTTRPATTVVPPTTEAGGPPASAPPGTVVTSTTSPTTATTRPATTPTTLAPVDPPPAPPDPPPAPPAPVIGGFRVTRPGTACLVEMVWQSTNADAATISGVGAVPTSGSTTACVTSGTTITLTVTGPGGTVSTERTAP